MDTNKHIEALKQLTTEIKNTNSEEELSKVLTEGFAELDIRLPWTGDFDEFMSDPSSKLTF